MGAHDGDSTICAQSEKLKIAGDKIVGMSTDGRSEDQIVFGMRCHTLNRHRDLDEDRVVTEKLDGGLLIGNRKVPTEIGCCKRPPQLIEQVLGYNELKLPCPPGT